MIVEHYFISSEPRETVMKRILGVLGQAGFIQTHEDADGIAAKCGKRRPASRKIRKLPQTLEATYDRGKVSLAIGMMTRCNADRSVHAQYLSALAVAIERGVAGEHPSKCLATWLPMLKKKVWLPRDVVALVLLGIIVLIIALIIVASVASSHR